MHACKLNSKACNTDLSFSNTALAAAWKFSDTMHFLTMLFKSCKIDKHRKKARKAREKWSKKKLSKPYLIILTTSLHICTNVNYSNQTFSLSPNGNGMFPKKHGDCIDASEFSFLWTTLDPQLLLLESFRKLQLSLHYVRSRWQIYVEDPQHHWTQKRRRRMLLQSQVLECPMNS